MQHEEELERVLGQAVSRETLALLETYAELLLIESKTQNLISKGTLDEIWPRHIIDSAQLVPLLGHGPTLDVGSGAGLPGIIIAILSRNRVTLVEPRRLRAEFLERTTGVLRLGNVSIIQTKVLAVRGDFANITARAVASATDLFRMAIHLSRHDTRWVLPKGKSTQKELDEAQSSWQGKFRLEQSRTDADASILIATDVRPRGGK